MFLHCSCLCLSSCAAGCKTSFFSSAIRRPHKAASSQLPCCLMLVSIVSPGQIPHHSHGKCWLAQDVTDLANSPGRASDGDVAMTEAPAVQSDKLEADVMGAPASSSQPSSSPGAHTNSPKQPAAPSVTPEPVSAAAAAPSSTPEPVSAAAASSAGTDNLAVPAADGESPSLSPDARDDKAGPGDAAAGQPA